MTDICDRFLHILRPHLRTTTLATRILLPLRDVASPHADSHSKQTTCLSHPILSLSLTIFVFYLKPYLSPFLSNLIFCTLSQTLSLPNPYFCILSQTLSLSPSTVAAMDVAMMLLMRCRRREARCHGRKGCGPDAAMAIPWTQRKWLRCHGHIEVATMPISNPILEPSPSLSPSFYPGRKGGCHNAATTMPWLHRKWLRCRGINVATMTL